MLPILIAVCLGRIVTADRQTENRLQDQIVLHGENATFHCNIQSTERPYWRINGISFYMTDRYSKYSNFIYNHSIDGMYYNITVTVITLDIERENTNFSIECFYEDNQGLQSIGPVYLFILHSCLSLPGLAILNTTVYFGFNGEPLLTEIILQLPSLCEDHYVNLTIRIEDNLQNHFASKGPIEYRGSIQVMELVRVRLEKEQTYWIQVEAEIAEQRILSNKWLIDTNQNFTDKSGNKDTNQNLNLTCTSNKVQSGIGTNKTLSDTNQNLNLTCTSNKVNVLIVGGLMGAILSIIIICLFIFTFLRRFQKKRIGHNSSQVMVINPIYDGPIYDSIPQQLSTGFHTQISDSTSSKPNNGSPTSPNHVNNLNEYENIPVSNSSAVTNAPTSQTSTSPITSKERKTLKLTLSLEGEQIDSCIPYTISQANSTGGVNVS